MAKYFSMNNIELGSRLKVNGTGKIGKLVEIFHFPTLFKIEYEEGGGFDVFKTHEITIVEESESKHE